jgi:hypothetical protein
LYGLRVTFSCGIRELLFELEENYMRVPMTRTLTSFPKDRKFKSGLELRSPHQEQAQKEIPESA